MVNFQKSSRDIRSTKLSPKVGENPARRESCESHSHRLVRCATRGPKGLSESAHPELNYLACVGKQCHCFAVSFDSGRFSRGPSFGGGTFY